MSKQYIKETRSEAIESAKRLCTENRFEEGMNRLLRSIQIRRRAQWEDEYENVIKLYIEIGVNNQIQVKEGLLQYRLLTQQNKPESLEKILKLYIDLSEEKGNNEREKLIKNEENNNDNNNNVIIDKNKIELKNEQFNSPVLKYQWDCYQTILNVLRNNGKLNNLHQDVVFRSIKFCKELDRTTEFRRLCDTIRKRLGYVENNQDYDYALKLKSVDTLTSLFKTRLELLECALYMNLFQESFKLTYDIHHILKLSNQYKIKLNNLLFADYYEKVAKVFWSCHRYLLHAYSLYKAYKFREKEYEKVNKKKRKPDDIKKLEQSLEEVIISTLIIPENKAKNDTIMNDEATISRIGLAFGFPPQPTKQGLIATLLKEPLLSKLAKDFYELIELSFDPINFCNRLKSLIKLFENNNINIKFYEDKLQNISIIRLLTQLSKIYRSISWNRFKQLSFPDLNDEKLERIITNAVRASTISVRLSHSEQMLTFCDEDMESDLFCNHLVTLASQLANVDEYLTQDIEIHKQQRINVFKIVQENMNKDHSRISKRLEMITKQQMEFDRTKKKLQEKEQHDKQKKNQELKIKQQEENENQKRLREERERKKQIELDKNAKVKQLASKIFHSNVDILGNNNEVSRIMQSVNNIGSAAQTVTQIGINTSNIKKFSYADIIPTSSSSASSAAASSSLPLSSSILPIQPNTLQKLPSTTRTPLRPIAFSQKPMEQTLSQLPLITSSGNIELDEQFKLITKELEELLKLAASGQLSDPSLLQKKQDELQKCLVLQTIERLRQDRKNTNYLIRCYRKYEQPHIEEEINKRKLENIEIQKQQYKEMVQEERKNYKTKLMIRDRLSNIKSYTNEFLSYIKKEQQHRIQQDKQKELDKKRKEQKKNTESKNNNEDKDKEKRKIERELKKKTIDNKVKGDVNDEEVIATDKPAKASRFFNSKKPQQPSQPQPQPQPQQPSQQPKIQPSQQSKIQSQQPHQSQQSQQSRIQPSQLQKNENIKSSSTIRPAGNLRPLPPPSSSVSSLSSPSTSTSTSATVSSIRPNQTKSNDSKNVQNPDNSQQQPGFQKKFINSKKVESDQNVNVSKPSENIKQHSKLRKSTNTNLENTDDFSKKERKK